MVIFATFRKADTLLRPIRAILFPALFIAHGIHADVCLDNMETQTVTIQIDVATAAMLQARAEAQGITVDELLRLLAEGLNGTQERTAFEMTGEEKARAFDEWVTLHSVKGVIADDSRESIYTREDDAL